jgi:gliding motility-associated-like protein
LTLTGDILRPFSKPLDDIGYKLVATDLNGCRDSATIDIELERDRNLYIPNIFSPNDDGDDRNNFFTVFSGPGVKKINYLRVYDRWGELLYVRTNLPVSNEPSVGWDGKFNGKFVNQGVYVFISEVEFEDGAVLIYRGDVTVVR